MSDKVLKEDFLEYMINIREARRLERERVEAIEKWAEAMFETLQNDISLIAQHLGFFFVDMPAKRELQPKGGPERED